MKHKNAFPHLSAAPRWAAVFGKGTIPRTSRDYATIMAIGACLIEEGYGVVHGGYAGGAMEAVSRGANSAIRRLGVSVKRNVGVPHAVFDAQAKRVKNATFTTMQKDIFGRLQVISQSDIAVVSPRGGIGTFTELILVLHENETKRSIGAKTQSLIFVISKTGTDWKTVLSGITKHLSVSTEDVYFVHSIRAFRSLLKKLAKQ